MTSPTDNIVPYPEEPQELKLPPISEPFSHPSLMEEKKDAFPVIPQMEGTLKH